MATVAIYYSPPFEYLVCFDHVQGERHVSQKTKHNMKMLWKRLGRSELAYSALAPEGYSVGMTSLQEESLDLQYACIKAGLA